MKKSIIIFSILILSCLMIGAGAASSSGGLQDGTYLIYDSVDLTAFATYVNGDVTHVSTNAKLMDDIDLTGVSWTPIGTSSNAYAGTFDGNGKVISNLYYHGTAGYYGLFGYVTGATIQNVGLEDVDIESTGIIVGGFIGYAVQSSAVTVQNCYVTGDITAERYVGGIGGHILVGTISNCYVNADISVTSSESGNYESGGITSFSRYITIQNCYVAGTVSSCSDDSSGIIQTIVPTSSISGNTYIRSCVVLSTLDSSGTNIWGVFTNTYGKGTETITGSNNYAVSGGSDASSKAGLSKTLAEIQATDGTFFTTASNWGSYTWDFADTWYWDTTDSLPKLQIFREIEAPAINSIEFTSGTLATISESISGYVNASPSTEGLTLSYQWAYSTNSAVSWSNISGQTSATLSYTPQTAGTYYFKVYVSDSGGATDSYTAGFTNVFVKVLNVYTPGNVSTKTSSIQAKTLETYQATNEFDFSSTILDVKYVDDTTAYVAAGNAIYVVDGTGATISPLTTYTGNTISSVYLGSTRAIINDVDNNVAVYDYSAKTMEYIATNGSSKVAISPNYAYVVNDTGYLNIYNSSGIVASMQYTYSYLDVNQITDVFGYAFTQGSYIQYTGYERKLNYYSFDGTTITSHATVVGYDDNSNNYRANPIGNSKYWVIYNPTASGFFRIVDISSIGTSTTTVSYSPGVSVNQVNAAETLSSIFSHTSVIYVYGSDAALQGQYTAGGNLNDLSLSYSNGLYAIAGGNDSNAYFINKESSSSWVLGQATNFNEAIYHAKISYDGQLALIGTTYKLFLFKYSESVESTYYINGVVVGSDGLPYANKIITIDATSITTDDSGFFVYPVKPGQTYTIITGSKTTKYTATNQALQTLSIKITSQLVAQDVTYGASYNSTSSNIEMNYNDAADKTSIVVWSVRDTKTGQEVSRQSVSAGTQAYYFVPSNKTSDNYFVTVSATRGNTSVKNTWSITPSGEGQSVNLFGMDDTGKNILFGFFIILLAGLFGYLHQHIGTIIVAFAAAILRYLGLITVPWIMILIAVVVAIVAAIAHRGEGK